ncbi:uncharacterized protein LOC134235868 [Saccostrea cucullata]|uniref:uncharacterized protein LOC134235868 n=1 Tax=Saccostrea cuccullata TaxID=36930 RepID=UPI002ED47E73
MALAPGSRGNFVRLGIAIIDHESNMLRLILENEVPPSDIEQKAVKKIKKLQEKQKDLLKMASTASNYSDLDITFLYTLIRNVCSNVPKPTNGWGGDTMPEPGHILIGDDIERIRLMRNEVYGHVADTWMSDTDFQKHFQIIREISKRMDTYFSSKNKTTQFEVEINRIETMSLDENAEQKYVQKIKDMEERERKLAEKIVELEEHLTLCVARGDKAFKIYKNVTLSDPNESGLSMTLTDTFLKDLGCIINGIERFIRKEGAIEKCLQMYQCLRKRGVAETRRTFHNVLNELKNFARESQNLVCPLENDQEINMMISIFDFIMFIKKYECNLECFMGSLFMCYKFPINQPPDNKVKDEINKAFSSIILKDEHLSLYHLPGAKCLNLVIRDIEETAFTEFQRRRGTKRKAESDAEEDKEEKCDGKYIFIHTIPTHYQNFCWFE